MSTMILDRGLEPLPAERVIDCSNAPLITPEGEVVIASDYAKFRRRYPQIKGGATAAIPAIPFVASAHEHAESSPVITQALVLAGPSTTYELNVPSYGYIRHIWLDINATGGTGVAAVYAGDAPFNAIDALTFLDTNGAPIYGPLSGFSAFITNLFGGYTYQQDPRSLPTYNAGNTAGNFRWQVRIPLEISHHDATGCLGNQNSSAPYRIRVNINAPANIYTTPPTGYPTVTITPILEAWSLPNSADPLGRPQSQVPPNYGTVQYWSTRFQTGLAVGTNTVQVLRVGNLIRNLIFICRDTNATGARDDTVFPTAPIINWDARQLFNETQTYRATRSYESLESIPTLGRPVGVYAYSFARTNQDRVGDDKPWLWLPTVEATRLELNGSFATGGVVEVLVNDIAPAEVNPSQRYVQSSATGFHPNPDFPNANQA